MVVRETKINPEMLRWARECAGYTVGEIAGRRGVPSCRILNWESGKEFPTWRQLERLAFLDYRRSPTLFFLNSPPDEKYVEQEFDRLPSAMLNNLHPDTLYAVRQARIRQEHLALLHPDDATSRVSMMGDLSGEAEFALGEVELISLLVSRLATALSQPEEDWDNTPVRDDLLEDLTVFRPTTINDGLSWFTPVPPVLSSGSSFDFENWRSLLIETGVWVFQRPFKQKDVNGFCFNHDRFPVIYLNSALDHAGRISTMLNEWAHIAFDFNHIERSDRELYLEELTGVDHRIEATCQRFAAGGWQSAVWRGSGVTSNILDFSASRGISMRGSIDRLAEHREDYHDEVLSTDGEGLADDQPVRGYYAIQKSLLGEQYIRAAFTAFEAERIDELELSAALGVKGRYLQRLGDYALL